MHTETDLSPAIILLERHLMTMSSAEQMRNVHGLTPTEIKNDQKVYDNLKKPYVEAIRFLKQITK